jgi:hypothetical protein
MAEVKVAWFVSSWPGEIFLVFERALVQQKIISPLRIKRKAECQELCLEMMV